MLADSLLDYHWANRSRRGWMTLVACALQALGISLLLLLPLIYTQGLPRLQKLEVLGAPAPPPGPPPAPARMRSEMAAQSNMIGERLLTPSRIPHVITSITETTPPPSIDPGGSGILGSTGNSSSNNSVIASIGNSIAAVLPPPPRTAAHTPRISRVMEGNLIYKVQPDYPPAAKAARIQGPVVLKALISKYGGIENLRVLSGHPMLVRAAMDAVSQWRYRPYYLNGEPVAVETQVTVNFVLAGG